MSWPKWLSYGMWTAPGLSGGIWTDDPGEVDYTLRGIDELDEAARLHDIDYLDGVIPRWVADFKLVRRAWNANVKGTKANVWRVLVIVGMSAAGAVRWVAQ